MAKNRYINTHFWNDGYISELDPIEKLLFIYFLTNPLTNICGIYEIVIKRIAFDTGIDKDMVMKILSRFHNDDKIMFEDGWIAIKNFIKHQAVNSNIKKGIEDNLALVPKPLKAFLSLSKPSNYLTKLKPNLNLKGKVNKEDLSIIPSYEQIERYCNSNKYSFDINHFIDYQEARGWMVAGSKMKNWKALTRTWVSNQKKWVKDKAGIATGKCPTCDKDYVSTYKGIVCPKCEKPPTS